jgi:hypothetical protein
MMEKISKHFFHAFVLVVLKMVKMLNFAQGKGRIGIGVTISKYK